jgi:antirestriction protein
VDDQELDKYDDVYLGYWPSVSNYVEDLLDDIGLQQQIDQVVPFGLQPYVMIDVEVFARDLELGGDIAAIEGDGGVYVFRGTWSGDRSQVNLTVMCRPS